MKIPYEYLKSLQEERREHHKYQDWWREFDPEFMITGLAGEWIFSQEFDLPMNVALTDGGDGGVDFETPEYRIDIKTVKYRYKPPLLLREASKEHCEVLVLAVFYSDTHEVDLLGWAYDKDVVKGAPVQNKWTNMINYVHRIDQLKPMDELKELLKED